MTALIPGTGMVPAEVLVRAVALLLVVSCSTTNPPSPDKGGAGTSETTGGTTGTTGTGSGWCGVEQISVGHCTSCHAPAAGNLGGLDLATDPYAALVGVASFNYPGATLVVPGDSAGSLLYRKVSGTQAPSEGALMPPTGALGAADAATVQAWIDAGASADCGTTPTGTGGRYHPENYADPAVHGLAAKLQDEACVSCHGDDLLGGTVGVSCDSCHDANGDGTPDDTWRTTCTYCHGGTLDTTGAPPRDIDGTTDLASLSFSPHHVHVTTAMRDSLDCTECHQKPDNVLAQGHIFLGDTTPAVAEVDYTTGISAGGNWDGASCGVYCHSNGQTQAGNVSVAASPMGCDGCHAAMTSSNLEWQRMSGHHDTHLDEGYSCATCHETTVDNQTIARGDLHIDGTPEVTPPASSTIVWDAAQETCTGSCHGENHFNRHW